MSARRHRLHRPHRCRAEGCMPRRRRPRSRRARRSDSPAARPRRAQTCLRRRSRGHRRGATGDQAAKRLPNPPLRPPRPRPPGPSTLGAQCDRSLSPRRGRRLAAASGRSGGPAPRRAPSKPLGEPPPSTARPARPRASKWCRTDTGRGAATAAHPLPESPRPARAPRWPEMPAPGAAAQGRQHARVPTTRTRLRRCSSRGPP